MHKLSHPKIQLGHWPTPLEPMLRINAMHKGPELWVKRDDCLSGTLVSLQQYIGETEARNKNEPVITEEFIFELYERVYLLEKNTSVIAKTVTAIEQNASEMDERVYLMEQSAESVRAFRRDTNRMLNELQSQIHNLAYLMD